MNQNDVKDIRSLAPPAPDLRHDVRQPYGYGQWKQGMKPAVLRAFPAARLIRDRGVMEPRPRHQNNLGEVLLKTDPRWAEFHNDPKIGGFGVPWGPYGFNSGVTQEDVSRREARKLGLPVDEVTPQEKKVTDGTQASTKKMDPDIKAKLLKDLRSGPNPKDPAEVARQAAANTRRIMLNRGLAEAEARGDTAKAEKYRKAIADLQHSNQSLAVIDEGDRIRIGEDVGERLAKKIQRGTDTNLKKSEITDSILKRINQKSSEGSTVLRKGVQRKELFNEELTLTQEEKRILEAPYEIVIAYDPDGKLIKAVTEYDPEQSPVPQGLQPGSIFSHQHPGGRGPSAWDLDYLGRNRHLISRIVTVNEVGKREIFEVRVHPNASQTDCEQAALYYRKAVDIQGNTAHGRREALELLSHEFPDIFLLKSRQL